MKKILLLFIIGFSLQISAQVKYIKIEVKEDTTYLKKHKGKLYEHQEFTTTDNKKVTIVTEIKETEKNIKKIQQKITSLKEQMEFLNEEIHTASKEAALREKRKKQIQRKIDFNEKRLKNIRKRKK